MKVRIIKTSIGYIPQAYTTMYYEKEASWYSLSSTFGFKEAYAWITLEYIYSSSGHLTKWGAMRTLKKWLKQNVEGTVKLEAFKKELENPNVVYEAEV